MRIQREVPARKKEELLKMKRRRSTRSQILWAVQKALGEIGISAGYNGRFEITPSFVRRVQETISERRHCKYRVRRRVADAVDSQRV